MRRLLLLFALVFLPAMAFAQAPNYTMRWSVLGAAGGPASGSGYDLDGVGGMVGGLLQGGAYTLYGGYPPPLMDGSVDVEPVDPIPLSFHLRAPQPSPFRDRVTIAFELPDERQVSVLVYSIDGRRLVQLADAKFGAGHHRVLWDGKDGAGRTVHSGMYFVRVNAGGASATQRLVRVQ